MSPSWPARQGRHRTSLVPRTRGPLGPAIPSTSSAPCLAPGWPPSSPGAGALPLGFLPLPLLPFGLRSPHLSFFYLFFISLFLQSSAALSLNQEQRKTSFLLFSSRPNESGHDGGGRTRPPLAWAVSLVCGAPLGPRPWKSPRIALGRPATFAGFPGFCADSPPRPARRPAFLRSAATRPRSLGVGATPGSYPPSPDGLTRLRLGPPSGGGKTPHCWFLGSVRVAYDASNGEATKGEPAPCASLSWGFAPPHSRPAPQARKRHPRGGAPPWAGGHNKAAPPTNSPLLRGPWHSPCFRCFLAPCASLSYKNAPPCRTNSHKNEGVGSPLPQTGLWPRGAPPPSPNPEQPTRKPLERARQGSRGERSAHAGGRCARAATASPRETCEPRPALRVLRSRTKDRGCFPGYRGPWGAQSAACLEELGPTAGPARGQEPRCRTGRSATAWCDARCARGPTLAPVPLARVARGTPHPRVPAPRLALAPRAPKATDRPRWRAARRLASGRARAGLRTSRPRCATLAATGPRVPRAVPCVRRRWRRSRRGGASARREICR